MDKNNWISIYFKPKILSILFLGIASGLPFALIASTLSAWLTEIGINKSSIGAFALISIPFTLKFLWAPLIDSIYLPYLNDKLGHRKSWMLVVQLLLALAIFITGSLDPNAGIGKFAVSALFIAFFAATQDIIIDAYRIERLIEAEQGVGAAMTVTGYRIGLLISGAGALIMAESFAWNIVYGVMSVILLLCSTIIMFFFKEPSDRREDSKQETLSEIIKRVVSRPFSDFINRHQNWLLLLLFIIMFKLGDALAGIMTTPFLIETGFSKSEIAVIVKFYGLFSTIAGTFIGGALVYKLGNYRALYISAVLQMLSNLMFCYQSIAGHDNAVLTATISIENLCGGIGSAAFVAFLSSICNPVFAATQYALLSSIAVFGRDWIAASSGYIAEQLGWFSFFIFTAFAAVPGIILLSIINRNTAEKDV